MYVYEPFLMKFNICFLILFFFLLLAKMKKNDQQQQLNLKLCLQGSIIVLQS